MSVSCTSSRVSEPERHGKIAPDLVYYFATYETDSKNLKDSALPCTELEGLLDATLARQRLVLLDTCESGEVYVDPESAKKIAAKAPVKDTTATERVQRMGGLMRGLPGASLTEDNAASLAHELFICRLASGYGPK